MAKHLVIVESPAKSKTIEKYLGKDYKVLASYGHVRDLVPKEGAVDPDADFAMRYEVIDRNAKHVNAIIKELKSAESLLLATDPDREGEAISWHLYELLKEKNKLKDKTVQRVVFYEITKSAVQEAIANPRELSNHMVDAQQARRALDYLVGFNISPLLWRKVRPGLSAGRVQSPALRMIVEREEEIQKFEPQEYWTVEADCEKTGQGFISKLITLKGDKVKQFDINNEALATDVKTQLMTAANGELLATKVDKKQRKRNPAPPFTTSTMQQEASRKIGFGTSRTMRTAQQLYEGIDIGEGPVGLITYMRTDAVTLSNDALGDIRGAISQRYGADQVPETPRQFKTKSKNAQEAHEAIRPTAAARHPDEMAKFLSPDQLKLYGLIWRRAVASQMIHATFDTVALTLSAGDAGEFRANGSVLIDPGFIAVYQEGRDDANDDDDDKRLPAVEEGDKITLHDIRPEQHFTEPPPRYSEASLVKSLEEYGIGRPSTYASIIQTLVKREYVELESRRFFATDVGRIVAGFLTNHFTRYVDYDFTANLEDDLDAISRGEKEWHPVMQEWWSGFKKQVDEKQDISREEVAQARQLGTDPKSGKPVSVRLGRYGPFVQIGTKDDEEKPTFASLRPGQKMNDITFEDAMELFKLPRKLGETDEGKTIAAAIGRFGPYIRYGDKFVSIKEPDDPYTIELDRAKELIAAKIKADLEKIIATFDNPDDPDTPIQILKGRWGPYITDGNKNAKIPKDADPTLLTLQDCIEAIAAAPEKKGRGRKKAAPKKAAAKKTATKKAPAKKAAAKKTPAKKAATKKTAAKKPAAKKVATKKATTKKT